ncbi:hypothetical protein ACLBW2_03525 [Enterobacteriaceae bacterium C23F]
MADEIGDFSDSRVSKRMPTKNTKLRIKIADNVTFFECNIEKCRDSAK